ncbi:antifungal protein ginkbilobin-2 [Nicotiana attenuata]|uniref:Antifungal protein ginkbilobin-2 n=1 Tax=Nicotiana attenuata TaxID=49451 RepID=A0A1J6IUS4_NICAT|nr:antifungal protein ginkbilobin-2 [Nicotiana attenuata]
MDSTFRMIVLTIFLIGLMWFSCSVRSEELFSKPLDHTCNGDVYDKNGPFSDSLYYVLVGLENETPKQGYDYYITSPYPNDALAYGHASCTSSVAYSDCDTCVKLARSYLLTVCDGRIGGQVEFVDCSMRYEQYSFSK